MTIDLFKACTQTEFAMVVGITQPAASVLMSEKKLPSEGALIELIQAYCQRLREQAAGRLGGEIGGLDLVQERAALAREQRLGIEIKNAVARGEYAPISLLAEVLAMASQSVVERLEQLPSTLKKSCPDLPEAARDQVMTILASARNEWVHATEALVLTHAEALQEAEADTLIDE